MVSTKRKASSDRPARYNPTKTTLELAALLKEIREARDQSIRSLAKYIKINASLIGHTEMGMYAFPLTYIKALSPLMNREEKLKVKRLLVEQLDAELGW